MHIPDGLFLHGGALLTASAVISTAGCGLALWRAKRTLGDRQIPLLGMTAAFIFAAQMLNFPVAGGTSGHFVGALLAALLLGPANALLVMAVVLVIQCLLFADGGVTALGVNVLNMGVIGGVAAFGVFKLAGLVLPRTRGGFLASAAVAAWASVVLAAAACAAELAYTGTIPLRVGLTAMLGVHVLIGVGEAIITAAAISLVLVERPDLVSSWRPAGPAQPTEAGP